MPSIEEIILGEVKESREDIKHLRQDVQNLGTRITAVEIELRNTQTRVKNLNGCANQTAEEVDELQTSVELLEKSRWSRGDKINAIMVYLVAFSAVTALVISIVTLVAR